MTNAVRMLQRLPSLFGMVMDQVRDIAMLGQSDQPTQPRSVSTALLEVTEARLGYRGKNGEIAKRPTCRQSRLEPPGGLNLEQQKMLLAIDIMRAVFERNLSDAEAAEITGARVAEVKAIRNLKFDEVDLRRLREMVSRLPYTD